MSGDEPPQPKALWKQALLARGLMLGMGLMVLLGAYLVLLPLLDPAQRNRAQGSAPEPFVIGALAGTVVCILDRISPRVFRRLSTRIWLALILPAIGVLILLSESTLFLLFVGVAGFVVPILSPLARFSFAGK
jgi:hypothetical protein